MGKDSQGRRTDRTPDFESPIQEIENKIEELKRFAASSKVDLSGQIERLAEKRDGLKREIYSRLSPWQRVQIARHTKRPQVSDILEHTTSEFVELHGDRAFRDDRCIVTGLAVIGGERFMVLGHRKGRGIKEKLECNFGCPHPEGYRKAVVKMRLAGKMGLPVLSLIDTPGAYPGIAAEERGQAFAIASAQKEMAGLRVPVICVVIGEGGSGGAVGIGVGDRIFMLEHAYYSVISPEGCAAILWKDARFAERAAKALKLTAEDLLKLGVIDEILPEPLGGAHRDPAACARTIKDKVLEEIKVLRREKQGDLVGARYEKFKAMGRFLEHV